MRESQPPLSEAEWKVMNAVWARRGEVCARDVHAVLSADTGWAYTTVKTLMDRLAQKGVLEARVERNVSWYASRLPRGRAIATAARALAARAFGGGMAPLVHHLVRSERMSARDRAELRRMLDEADGRGKARE